jgi:hypothetical protein
LIWNALSKDRFSSKTNYYQCAGKIKSMIFRKVLLDTDLLVVPPSLFIYWF